MKKLVYLTPSLYIAGGVERVLTTHVNWLAQNTNYEITIILTDGFERPPYYDLSPKVNVINLNLNFEKLWKVGFIKKCWLSFFLQKKYKQSLSQVLFDIKPDITISLLRREINFINDIHDGSKKWGWLHVNKNNYRNFEKNDSNIIKQIFAKVWMKSLIGKLQKLDKFIVLTEEDKENWHEIPNISVISNPIPSDSSQVSNSTSKEIISVGRYTYQKGQDLLLEAWKLVTEKHPDWHLSIYGSGDKDKYQAIADKLNLTQNTSINNAVSNINDKYCDSSIYVMSSRFEGFGMVLIEAMNYGLPVVSFECPCGPKDIITNGVNGFLAERENPTDLANKICLLIENESLRKSMAIQAKQDSKKYLVDNVMEKWTKLFNEA